MTAKPPAIGIDLGTTYSCVALFRTGNVEILANEQGNRTTPSYVAFTEKERLIGQAAKDQAGTNPKNTIFDSKRLIGRKIFEETVQEDMLNWPFQVIGKSGKPHIRINYQGKKELDFPPEEVSSMILMKMKEIASGFHGTEINKAVVTVPAYFNDSQRQATKDAAKIAGLEILRIVNEPTAAGIAYGFKNKDKYKRNVLVFDFGGGTFDVSILTIENGVYNVLATAGDTHLGGEDCDTNMVNHFVEEIKRKYKTNLKDNTKAIYRLRIACERAKRNLSTDKQASINVDSLFDNTDFNSTITRGKFENINADLFDKLRNPILKALDDAELSNEQIDSIVLVGGSSRINLVNKLIKDLFPNKDINKNINPDEAVAFGAAILAAHLNGDEHESLKDFQLKDVTPLSLGIEVVGGQMEVLIERNTELPTSATKIFTTNSDNQAAVSIVVYEGERPLVKDNNKLGEFVINGIPRANREVPKIEVKFEISHEGIMQIMAEDKRSGASKAQMTIQNDKGRLSEPEIRRMIQDAAKFREDDEKEQARVRAKIDIEDYCLQAESKVAKAKGRITKKEKENVEKICQEYLLWLEDNPDEDITKITKQFQSLQLKCDQTLAKC